MTTDTTTRLPIVCIARTPAAFERLRETLATHLPSATVEFHDEMAVDQLPPSRCVVVDDSEEMGAFEGARRLRAGGYSGPLVIILSADDADVRTRAAQIGVAASVSRKDMANALAPAIAAAIRQEGTSEESALDAELRRTQRLIAAGDIALNLQHDLNNPLAGLLAEAQLLEMESLPPEQLDAVRRIVQLCRRMIIIVRRLDVVNSSSDVKRDARASTPPPR